MAKATENSNTISVMTPTPGTAVLAVLAGRFRSDARSAAAVRAFAANARAFRVSAWPAHPPRIAERPAPATPVPALVVIAPQPVGRTTVRRVLDVTAEQLGATVEALITDRRVKKLCRQRQVAMFVAMKLTGRSLPFVASKLGGRRHTTVLHGKRVVQALIDAGDADTIDAVNAIVAKLTGGANV